MEWASWRRTTGGVSRSEAAIAAPSGDGLASSAANRALVAHSTRPDTRDGWRRRASMATGTAHRVADGHELVDAEHIGEGDNVIRAVLETERQRRAHATAVAAVVEGDHPERR